METKNNNIAVLAYSGGLDTSYCAVYLTRERKLRVHSVIVNTGGFSATELVDIEKRAYSLGVEKHTTIDATQRFYDQCVKYLIYGNVLRNNTYPLSVSAERIFQALAIAEYTRNTGAAYIAHGSTGAGNDQVRFDLAFQTLCPDVQIITPIRDKKLSRQEEVAYLQNHGVDYEWKKAQYSINKGIWGTSVGGAETLTSHQSLPESAYPTQVSKTQPESITIQFEKGEPIALNGKQASAVDIIQQINAIAAPYGIGRDTHVGDTIVGIKGRVGFEAAAPLIVIKAHHLLEKHTLTKWQQYWKDQMATWYGMMVHEAMFLDPVMRSIEAFMTDSQQRVSGTVEVKLHPYRFELVGIQSPYDLMQSKFGSYGEMNNAWSGDDVKGFTKIISNQLKIYESLRK